MILFLFDFFPNWITNYDTQLKCSVWLNTKTKWKCAYEANTQHKLFSWRINWMCGSLGRQCFVIKFHLCCLFLLFSLVSISYFVIADDFIFYSIFFMCFSTSFFRLFLDLIIFNVPWLNFFFFEYGRAYAWRARSNSWNKKWRCAMLKRKDMTINCTWNRILWTDECISLKSRLTLETTALMWFCFYKWATNN